jgi:hypothetical protein
MPEGKQSKSIRVVHFNAWAEGAAPVWNDWRRFWDIFSAQKHAHIDGGRDGTRFVLLELDDGTETMLGRAATVAMVDYVLQSTEGVHATHICVADSYLQVQRYVMAEMTQQQYKFVYKAAKHAIRILDAL